MSWGNPPQALDVILSTRKLNRIIEHAAGDLTATVQAGCTVATLQKKLSERGQWLALDPLWPERATIGGIIAANDSGALRATYGTIRDQLIGVTVVLADGTIARSGGKVVKNVAGYDLPKLFTGALGTLGVIIEATFRLYSTPRASQTVGLKVPNTKALGSLIAALTELSLIAQAVQFQIDVADPIEIAILIAGLPEATESKLERIFRAGSDCNAERFELSHVVWSARERLFSDPEACVIQLSLLPTQWPAFIDRTRKPTANDDCRWHIVAQSAGVGTMSVTDSNPARLAATIKSIRADVEQVGGSLVILQRPRQLKELVDVWPTGSNAIPLMRRIKQQFDPHGTLSPGRFIGGI
jgi:glycolate oxidase FAD binding subunit